MLKKKYCKCVRQLRYIHMHTANLQQHYFGVLQGEDTIFMRLHWFIKVGEPPPCSRTNTWSSKMDYLESAELAGVAVLMI